MNFPRIIAATLLAFSSCAWAENEDHPQFQQLSQAIQSMREQEYDAFVVVEIPSTSHYFQFAAGSPNSYIFDVPTMSLTPEQNERAKAFFASRGIEPRSVDGINPETGETFSIESYQKRYRRNNADVGASMGINFMMEVLQHTDEIRIIEGWR